MVITTQPVNQDVPIDRTATFTVSASGTTPLSYQWSKNGVDIPGATRVSYTTPTVALGDSGSSFQVSVKNAFSSTTSDVATLAAGPRAPALGDLRYLIFEQVSLPGLGATSVFRGDSDLVEYANAVGSPLSIGLCTQEDGCGWAVFTYNLPPPMTGLTTWYNLGFNNLLSSSPSIESYLQSVATPNIVINSLDIDTTVGTYAVAWVKSDQSNGFDYEAETIPMGAGLQEQLQSTATADGEASRVITAVSFDDALGVAYLVSYGWVGDTTTAYETKTCVVPASEVTSTAVALAGQGYIVSAFGGNDADGYIVVGMRVQGDTLPRPINTGTGNAANADSAYFTPVVYLHQALIIQEQ